MSEYYQDSPEMVFFSWQPPPPDQQNGLIPRYDIVCTPSSDSGEPVNSMSNGALNATVGMFIPATQYSCTITASTSAGTGPGITVTVVTCELRNRMDICVPLLLYFMAVKISSTRRHCLQESYLQSTNS